MTLASVPEAAATQLLFRREARGQPAFVHNSFPLCIITAGEMDPDRLALRKQPVWLR